MSSVEPPLQPILPATPAHITRERNSEDWNNMKMHALRDWMREYTESNQQHSSNPSAGSLESSINPLFTPSPYPPHVTSIHTAPPSADGRGVDPPAGSYRSQPGVQTPPCDSPPVADAPASADGSEVAADDSTTLTGGAATFSGPSASTI